MRLVTPPVIIALLLAALLVVVYWLIAQPFVTPLRSKSPAVDIPRLQAHVHALSEEIYPRSYDQRAKLAAAAIYVRSQLASVGASPEEQVFTVDGERYRNIIARYGPSHGPVLVIGAHYDSYGNEIRGASFPGGYDDTTHTPGADDNASGVAGLIELARLLTRAPPNIGVELVAYSLEEPPHFRTEAMGSVQHARRLRSSGRKVELMISLEMIGYFSTDPQSQTYPVPGLKLIYPDRGDFIAIVGRIREGLVTRRVKAAMLGASDLPVYSMNALSFIAGIDFSDHSSYWNEGFPAVMITDTAFYRNPHYHQAGDTADRLDYERLAKVVQGVFAVTQTWTQ
jgi:Zn-dependent M28 family amino/carboxypeptidase